MAELVGPAIVQETVSQILSSLVQKYDEKEESNANRNLERLDMAHIRLEAALETSDKWEIIEAAGASLALLASVCSRAVSHLWPHLPALDLPAGSLATGHGDQTWTQGRRWPARSMFLWIQLLSTM